MKIYVAALYSTKDTEATLAKRVIEGAGHECTSQWITGGEDGRSRSEAAIMDLNDVWRADALILLTLPLGTLYKGGGRCVEFGYALGLGKKVAVVGDYENIFCHLPSVKVCSTVGAAIEFLEVDHD